MIVKPFLEIRFYNELGILEGYMLPMAQFVQKYFVEDSRVVLQFSHTTFQIEGRGLQFLLDALRRCVLQRIQAFNPARWGEPPLGQPKITRVLAITAAQAFEKSVRRREAGKS